MTEADLRYQKQLVPSPLRAGDRVRFVSPASTPDIEDVQQCAKILESWGLIVEFGSHAFKKFGYLAGRDEERLEDLNSAFRDPNIRAVFATRGGRGAFRIADKLDFDAVRHDAKWLVGFSEITILHLNLWKQCKLVGIHGALYGPNAKIDKKTIESLRSALMDEKDITLSADSGEPTSALTTKGQASGVLLGGNLDMISTASGWALPSMKGAILLIEAIDMGLGQVDRQLTMLENSGHLEGLKGIAVGQFCNFSVQGGWSIIDILRDHFERLDIPILGGLLLGHGEGARSTLLGAMAQMDASKGTVTLRRMEQHGSRL